MIVITLEKCPSALRGDLTKWLQEISLGVYVGQVSARVRDELWKRICESCKGGRATMVFSAQNEQHYDFCVHNTSWEPIDFDGIKLMLRPSAKHASAKKLVGPVASDARLRRETSNRRRKSSRKVPAEYAVVDLETTGLDAESDEIIEIGALKVTDMNVTGEYSALVNTEARVPPSITKLTGITDAELAGGKSLEDALDGLASFVGTLPLVIHNAPFDLAFLDAATDQCDLDEFDNETIDTLVLARKKMPSSGHRLDELVELLGIPKTRLHRALDDCKATNEVFLKLIEM